MPKLKSPQQGVTIRMYRQGHGDCFLLALSPLKGEDPVYVLIDCGYKPGSQKFSDPERTIGDIVDDIAESTGGRLDLVVLTHEHQDHLNGIWKKHDPYFDRFTINRAWLAWTESEDDPLAIELRQRHNDVLLNLVEARNRLAAGGDDLLVRRLDGLLGMEFGDDSLPAGAELQGLAKNPESSTNKQAIKLVKEKADKNHKAHYLCPGDGPLTIPGTGVRAYVFGPPRDPELLRDEEPHQNEAFPDDAALAFTFATAAAEGRSSEAPFDPRFRMTMQEAREACEPEAHEACAFFNAHYGTENVVDDVIDENPVPDNAPWRRIDNAWLGSAESLALALNSGINNTSLVLAFELPASKKVLFFVGDAQRGNWASWKDLAWQDGDACVSARDLLARTVLYKVGHHGSHNATLNGSVDDEHANLGWMGTGPAAYEFTAMITAVNTWARTANDPPWHHPLPSIKRELMKKAQGRVLQTDTNIDQCNPPSNVGAKTWEAFCERCTCGELYFDLTIEDS